MSDSSPICYLRQELRSLTPFPALPDGHVTRIDAHFYVQTDDTTQAGGAAASFCLSNGLECVEYTRLPQPLVRSQIADHESEHAEAYDLALSKGIGVVIALVGYWR
jgi:hypothetical protein